MLRFTRFLLVPLLLIGIIVLVLTLTSRQATCLRCSKTSANALW